MSLFAGIVSFGMPIAPQDEERLARAIARRAGSPRAHIARSRNAVFIAAGPVQGDGGPSLFASSSRLDNREEVVRRFSCEPSSPEPLAIRAAFERSGDAGIAALLGDFAFAHWDEGRRVLTLARDCMGQRGLFYFRGEGFLAFASHMSDLFALPQVPRELDERMLANFLALNHRETDETFYRGVLRVPARSIVRATPDGVERRHYWSPKLDAPPPFARDEDYIERARELFEQALRRKLRDTPRTAILLSGGFDSSAIAATLSRLDIADVTGYCGVPPEGFDRGPARGRYLAESDKIAALARMHPNLRVERVAPRGPHLRQSDPARFFPDVPLPHRSLCNLGWFGQIEDRIFADGHTVVLTGSQGNMTLSWDGPFSLAVLLRQGRLFRMLREARAIGARKRLSTFRVSVGEAVFPLLPPAVLRAQARLRGQEAEDVFAFSLLSPQVVGDLDLRTQWWKDGFDPLYRMRGTSAALRAHQIFDQLQYGRDMGAMRWAGGHEDLRDPYADRELIEFSLSVPETLFRRHGIHRWFARQVFADRLPGEILTETRRGEQAPNWFESLDARKSLIESEVERIEGSKLASRLIDVPRLKRLVTEWPADARAAEARMPEYRLALDRAVHVGQFIRWVEGGNA